MGVELIDLLLRAIRRPCMFAGDDRENVMSPPFVFGRSRRDHKRPLSFGKLHRHRADSTGRACDQNPLPALKIRGVKNRLPRS
jgi:hypothetical protein